MESDGRRDELDDGSVKLMDLSLSETDTLVDYSLTLKETAPHLTAPTTPNDTKTTDTPSEPTETKEKNSISTSQHYTDRFFSP